MLILWLNILARLAAIGRAMRWPLLFSALLLAATLAQARDSIVWASLDFPPWMILQGEYRGQGAWDLLFKEIQAQLPDYDHQVVEMNNVRYEQLAAAGAHVCKVYYFKTPERERVLFFSTPATVFLSNHIVMRRDKAALLGFPARTSLQQLLQDARFDGSFIEGRSYGAQSDQAIRSYLGRAHLHANISSNQSLFEFLLLGRTDYILEFPAVRNYFEHVLSVRPDLVNIAIEEAAPYNLTYVTCARTPWGAQVIARVNPILRHYLGTPAYRAAMLRWYQAADQAQLARYFPLLTAGSGTAPARPARP